MNSNFGKGITKEGSNNSLLDNEVIIEEDSHILSDINNSDTDNDQTVGKKLTQKDNPFAKGKNRNEAQKSNENNNINVNKNFNLDKNSKTLKKNCNIDFQTNKNINFIFTPRLNQNNEKDLYEQNEESDEIQMQKIPTLKIDLNQKSDEESEEQYEEYYLESSEKSNSDSAVVEIDISSRQSSRCCDPIIRSDTNPPSESCTLRCSTVIDDHSTEKNDQNSIGIQCKDDISIVSDTGKIKVPPNNELKGDCDNQRNFPIICKKIDLTEEDKEYNQTQDDLNLTTKKALNSSLKYMKEFQFINQVFEKNFQEALSIMKDSKLRPSDKIVKYESALKAIEENFKANSNSIIELKNVDTFVKSLQGGNLRNIAFKSTAFQSSKATTLAHKSVENVAKCEKQLEKIIAENTLLESKNKELENTVVMLKSASLGPLDSDMLDTQTLKTYSKSACMNPKYDRYEGILNEIKKISENQSIITNPKKLDLILKYLPSIETPNSNPINSRNCFNSINSINCLNSINSQNSINAINAINTLNPSNSNSLNSAAKYIKVENQKESLNNIANIEDTSEEIETVGKNLICINKENLKLKLETSENLLKISKLEENIAEKNKFISTLKKELENKDKLINLQSKIFVNIDNVDENHEEHECLKDHKDVKNSKDRKDQKEQKEQKELKELKDLKNLKELKDLKDHKGRARNNLSHFCSRNMKNEQSKTFDNIKEHQSEDELVKQIDSIIADFRNLCEQIIDKTMRNNINKQISSFEFLLKSLYSVYHHKIQESSSKINSLSIIVDQNKLESNSLRMRVNELMKELQSNLYPSDFSIISKLENLSLSNFEAYNLKLDEILKIMKVKQKKENNFDKNLKDLNDLKDDKKLKENDNDNDNENSVPVQIVELRDKEDKIYKNDKNDKNDKNYINDKRVNPNNPNNLNNSNNSNNPNNSNNFNNPNNSNEYSGSFIFPQKTIHIDNSNICLTERKSEKLMNSTFNKTRVNLNGLSKHLTLNSNKIKKEQINLNSSHIQEKQNIHSKERKPLSHIPQNIKKIKL